jgi:hypothetical protein
MALDHTKGMPAPMNGSTIDSLKTDDLSGMHAIR